MGVWTGGGAAADCTHVATDWSKGIASVVYTAATGCYTITFTDSYHSIVGYSLKCSQQTGVDPVVGTVRNGTFSSATKSVVVEINTAGTLTDLLTTDKLFIDFTFARFPPP